MRDAVLLNAAGALVAADGIGAGPGPLADAFPAALKRAAAAIDAGAARRRAGPLGGAVDSSRRRTHDRG